MADENIAKTPLALKTKAGRKLARARAAIAKEIVKTQAEGENIAGKAAKELDRLTATANDALKRLIDAEGSPYDDSLLKYDLVNAAVMVEAFAGTKAGKKSPPGVKKLEREFVDAAAEVEEFGEVHRKHLAVLYG